MDKHLIAYYVGILIIFITHIYMLADSQVVMMSAKEHAVANLLAGAMVAYYFMNRERYINF